MPGTPASTITYHLVCSCLVSRPGKREVMETEKSRPHLHVIVWNLCRGQSFPWSREWYLLMLAIVKSWILLIIFQVSTFTCFPSLECSGVALVLSHILGFYFQSSFSFDAGPGPPAIIGPPHQWCGWYCWGLHSVCCRVRLPLLTVLTNPKNTLCLHSCRPFTGSVLIFLLLLLFPSKHWG